MYSCDTGVCTYVCARMCVPVSTYMYVCLGWCVKKNFGQITYLGLFGNVSLVWYGVVWYDMVWCSVVA